MGSILVSFWDYFKDKIGVNSEVILGSDIFYDISTIIVDASFKSTKSFMPFIYMIYKTTLASKVADNRLEDKIGKLFLCEK